MKPSTVTFLSLVFVVLLNTSSPVCMPVAPQAKSNRPPEAVIKDFYRWYMHSLNGNVDPLSKRRAVLKTYVTARLIGEIDRAVKGPEGLNGDYFIDAQDWDPDWEKNISVANLQVKQSTATALVTLSGKLMPLHQLKVTLKQESGSWKIDKVAGAYR